MSEIKITWLIWINASALTYDAENHSVTAAGATYTYDGNSLRVKRVSSGTTTVYIFSGSKVLAEYVNGAAPASPTREYIYSGSTLLAKIEAGVTNYYHSDHLSARVITDSTGAVVGQRAHYPYGETWYETGTTTKMKFISYERDSETGNDFAMMRYSVNRLGRFNAPDPLAGSINNPQSLNRYAYVQNDPANLIDPLGLYGFIQNGCINWVTLVGEDNAAWVEPILCQREWRFRFRVLAASPGSDFGQVGGGGGFRDILKAALAGLAQRCKDLLPMDKMNSQLNSLNFLDAHSPNSPDANKRGSDISPGTSPMPLFQLARGLGAVVLPQKTSAPGKPLEPSNNIVIGSLWGGLGDWQGVTLVHEEVHSVTKMNDTQVWDFAKANGAVQAPNNSNPSWNFTNWLKAGCPDEVKK